MLNENNIIAVQYQTYCQPDRKKVGVAI